MLVACVDTAWRYFLIVYICWYPGAAILAAKAAQKTGSGYVDLFVDASSSIINII